MSMSMKTEQQATVIPATTVTPSSSSTTVIESSSASSKISTGSIVAIAALSLTVLVLCAMFVYFLYNRSQWRRRIQHQEQQEEEQKTKEKLRQEERARNIQKNLRLVSFCSSACSSSSTCSTATTVESTSSAKEDLAGCFTDLEAQAEQQQQSEEEDNDDSVDSSGDGCAICFGDFEEGHQISVSNNKECPHSFHGECITEWLLKQDGCPVCRRAYLEEGREPTAFAKPCNISSTLNGNDEGYSTDNESNIDIEC